MLIEAERARAFPPGQEQPLKDEEGTLQGH